MGTAEASDEGISVATATLNTLAVQAESIKVVSAAADENAARMRLRNTVLPT